MTNDNAPSCIHAGLREGGGRVLPREGLLSRYPIILIPPRATAGKGCRRRCGGGDPQPVKVHVSQCERGAQGRAFLEDFGMVWAKPTGILKTKKKLPDP